MKYDEYKKLYAPKARRKPRHLEEDIQVQCVEWFRETYPDCLIFAVPNGGSRNPREAYNMKKAGVMAGVSDLIAVGRGKVLFIEMKAKKNKQQETQKKFQKLVEGLQHRYVVCRTKEQFIKEVDLWV